MYNDDKFLVLMPFYGLPFQERRLEDLMEFYSILRQAVLSRKPILIIEDYFKREDKIFFGHERIDLSAPGLCDTGESDHKKERAPDTRKQRNGETHGGQKFKIKIRRGDGLAGDHPTN